MIEFYEIDNEYIDYLQKFDSKIYSTKMGNRNHTRKYIGVLFHNKNCKYIIPLSSYKPQTYDDMYESISFKKIANYAVLRINNMIPIIDSVIHKIDFSKETDERYKTLLQNEYRVIKSREKEIRRDSRIVYFYRLNDKNKNTKLYNICCNFVLLEEKSILYQPQDTN